MNEKLVGKDKKPNFKLQTEKMYKISKRQGKALTVQESWEICRTYF